MLQPHPLKIAYRELQVPFVQYFQSAKILVVYFFKKPKTKSGGSTRRNILYWVACLLIFVATLLKTKGKLS